MSFPQIESQPRLWLAFFMFFPTHPALQCQRTGVVSTSARITKMCEKILSAAAVGSWGAVSGASALTPTAYRMVFHCTAGSQIVKVVRPVGRSTLTIFAARLQAMGSRNAVSCRFGQRQRSTSITPNAYS